MNHPGKTQAETAGRLRSPARAAGKATTLGKLGRSLCSRAIAAASEQTRLTGMRTPKGPC